jgi:hypothetical protein
MLLTWFLKNWENSDDSKCKNIHYRKGTPKKSRGPAHSDSEPPRDEVKITCTKTPLAYCWYLYATETTSTQPRFLDISFLLSQYISGEMYVGR